MPVSLNGMRPVRPRVRNAKTPNFLVVDLAHETRAWRELGLLHVIEHGIQARLDRFSLRRGMDLQQWMCNELALAGKLIVVNDEA
jgi:hypothetical protein